MYFVINTWTRRPTTLLFNNTHTPVPPAQDVFLFLFVYNAIMLPVNSLVSKFEQLSQTQDPPITPSTRRVRVKRYDMPLHQSTLSFARVPSVTMGSARKTSKSTSSKQITPPAEELDDDTILVVLPDESTSEGHDDPALLTPSESVNEFSGAPSNTRKTRSPVKSRSKRVSRARKSQDATTSDRAIPAPDLSASVSEKLRNISGDTLVPDASLSPSSIVKQGVERLDLTWDMNSNSKAGEAEQEAPEIDNEDGDSKTDLELSTESGTTRPAKRVKIEEKSSKWEQRRKDADKNATRRSSRASMLVSKAAEVVSDLAATVLGKRSRASPSDNRPSTPSTIAQESQPVTKRQKLSAEGKELTKKDDGVSLAATNRALKSRAPKNKKWLISGLYAGQQRTFDPTKSESQNKRKSTGTAEPSAALQENSTLPLPMFAGARLLETGRDFRLPFDIFSPLPSGQPKPDEWRRVNKNVFVGDAAAEWRTNKFSEQSTCLCRPETGCDNDCMNKFMYYECDSRNCNLTEEQCGNRAFEGLRKRVKAGGQYNVGVEVLRTADRGYGVRACRTFEPNQIIVEYTGEIINQEECESRMHGLYKDNEVSHLHNVPS